MKRDAIEERPFIGQAMLERFAREKRALVRAKAASDGTRRKILNLHDSGARVESGHFVLEVGASDRRSFSRSKLEEILGPGEVERLLDLMPSTSYQTVKVVGAGGQSADPTGLVD